MKQLMMLVGPPGSGKTSLSANYPDFLRISQDDQGKEHLKLFAEALERGDSILLDRMNFSKDQRDRYLHPAREAGYKIKIIVLHVPSDICRARCTARQNHPTIKDEETARNAIGMFFRKYERVEDNEADEVVREYPKVVPAKETVVVSDLDSTLCDISHRLHHVRQEKKNWAGFFKDIPGDSVSEPLYQTLLALKRSGLKIIFCSGRPDDYKKQTKAWLATHAEAFSTEVYMRPRNDFRRDDIVKEILLEFEILPRYDIFLVLDDRSQVVSMWRKHKLTCFQVAEGEF